MADAPVRVLGDRVLVRPDVNANAPQQTDAGIYLASSLAAAVTGEDPTSSLHRGTVVAVGNPKHPLHHEAEHLAARLVKPYLLLEHKDKDQWQPIVDAAEMLRDLVRRQPCVSVGDDVLFSHDAGQDLTLDGETFVILHETDLLAVVVPEVAHG